MCVSVCFLPYQPPSQIIHSAPTACTVARVRVAQPTLNTSQAPMAATCILLPIKDSKSLFPKQAYVFDGNDSSCVSPCSATPTRKIFPNGYALLLQALQIKKASKAGPHNAPKLVTRTSKTTKFQNLYFKVFGCYLSSCGFEAPLTAVEPGIPFRMTPPQPRT